MAKNKLPEDEPKPGYIRKREKDGESVQLTCRIPIAEKKRFDEASALLREHKEDMQLVDVVRAALDEAATYVERHYHKKCHPAGALPVATPTTDISS